MTLRLRKVLRAAPIQYDEWEGEFESEGEGAWEGEWEAEKAPGGSLGKLTLTAKGKAKFSYDFTDDDLVWTARFIIGESGGRDTAGSRAVMWAMFNRYALFTHKVYPSFAAFIRRYSTTLQPVLHSSGAAKRHMNKPTFVKTGGTYPGTEIPKGQLKQFLALQKRAWSDLPEVARSLARRALSGQVANPIGNASEFASTRVYFHDHFNRWPDDAEWRAYTLKYAKGKGQRWVGDVEGLNQKDNAFFVDARAVDLPDGAVQVVVPSQAGGTDGEGEQFLSDWLPNMSKWWPGGATTPSPVAPAPAKPTGPPSKYFKDDPSLVAAKLAPATAIAVDAKWPKARRDLATTYNRLGGLMQAVATREGIEVAAVLGVFYVESRGVVLTPGAMIIRFENHKFWTYWGKQNAAIFDAHFRFNGHNGVPGNTWEGHQFRVDAKSGAWETSHPSKNQQTAEYRALQLAIQLGGDEPAVKSISMGGPQAMGFNYASLGYASAEDMYDNFQADERWHVLGFFDFCKSNNLFDKIKQHLWTDVAKGYNGSGQAASYGALLKSAFDEAVLLPLPKTTPAPSGGVQKEDFISDWLPSWLSPSAPPPTAPPQAPPSSTPEPVVTINSGVIISDNAVRTLKGILRAAGLKSATITSGRRSSSEQARVMFNLIRDNGVTYAHSLYGSYGDQVIDVYAAGKAAGRSDTQIKADMDSKIKALGPQKVSLHCSNDYDVFDVSPKSLANTNAFRAALDAAIAAGAISRYIPPPGDPAFHIEIKLAQQELEEELEQELEDETFRRMIGAPPRRPTQQRRQRFPQRPQQRPQQRRPQRHAPPRPFPRWLNVLSTASPGTFTNPPNTPSSADAAAADAAIAALDAPDAAPSFGDTSDTGEPTQNAGADAPADDGAVADAPPSDGDASEWESFLDFDDALELESGNAKQVPLDTKDSALVTHLVPAAKCWVNLQERKKGDITHVVIHTLQGHYAHAIGSWKKAVAPEHACAKPHYVVRNDGEITQVVAEKHIAAHACAANKYSIGIEHDGFDIDPSNYSEAMYLSSAALTRDICLRWSIPMDKNHVIGHDVADGNCKKPCSCHGDPGGFWDWDYYLALVNWDGKATTKPVRLIADFSAATIGPSWKRVDVNPKGRPENGPTFQTSWGLAYHYASPGTKVDKNDVVTFKMVVPTAGTYSVSAWWPIKGKYNAATQFVIARFGKTALSVPQFVKPAPVVQNKLAGWVRATKALEYTPMWHPLGTISCGAGDTVLVWVSRESTAPGFVIADTIRLFKA